MLLWTPNLWKLILKQKKDLTSQMKDRFILLVQKVLAHNVDHKSFCLIINYQIYEIFNLIGKVVHLLSIDTQLEIIKLRFAAQIY